MVFSMILKQLDIHSSKILAYIPQTQKSIIEPNTQSRGNPKRICDIGLSKNVLNMTSKEYRRNKNW